jgi:nucleotide-binding universal stress UspA family protein
MFSGAMGSKLLVGVDGSAASDAAVRWAAREATMRALPVELINIIAPTLFGSTMARTTRSHRARRVVRDPGSAQHEIRDDAPVLVGIDGSPASEGATALAFEEASLRRVPLVALHAWSDVGVFPILGMDWRTYRDEGEEVLGERLAGWQERYPDVAVHRRLECDVPARWLLEESKHAQLVVLGSHGRGGYAGMHLGSVSSAVVQSAGVPVIVVRNGK